MPPSPAVVVPDASVLAKWLLVDEEDAPVALRLRNAHLSGTVVLAVPALVLYELASVFAKRRAVPLSAAREFLTLVGSLEIPVIQPAPSAIGAAMELARQSGVSLYDAVYVQMAQDIGGFWVTADTRAVAALPPDAPAMTLSAWGATF